MGCPAYRNVGSIVTTAGPPNVVTQGAAAGRGGASSPPPAPMRQVSTAASVAANVPRPAVRTLAASNSVGTLPPQRSTSPQVRVATASAVPTVAVPSRSPALV